MIHWPKMQSLDMGFMRRTGTLIDINEWAAIRGWKVVQCDYDLGRLWVAPRWIGWLYRLLPNHFNVNLTAWKTEPSHFLVNVAAPTWRIGLTFRRIPNNGRVLPAVVVSLGEFLHWYLPWGNRLYLRFVMPSVRPRREHE